VRQLRLDVAAFGQPQDDEADGPAVGLEDLQRAAASAMSRASGALDFMDMAEPAARELRRLYDAVRPVVLRQSLTG
jgi:hypothetical protein